MAVQRFVCGLLCFWALSAWALPTVPERITFQSDGRTQVEIVSALLAPVDEAAKKTSGPQGSNAAQWPRQVELPDGWSKPQRSGRWRFDWTLQLAQAPAEGWGLYIPRAGNRFAVEVNGRHVAQVGDFGDVYAEFSQSPHLISLPRGTLNAGLNHFVIEVEGGRNRFAGLSRVFVGPEKALHTALAFRNAAHTGGTSVVVVMCSVFGALALVLYLHLRQPSDGFFALACWLCAVRSCYFMLESAPIGFPFLAWVADMSYAGLVACILAFCVRVLALNTARWNPLGIGFVVVSLVLTTWDFLADSHMVRLIWLMAMLGYVQLMSVVFIWQWWRLRTVTSALLGSAALGGTLIGVHDYWLVFFSPEGYGGFALARFALVLFILAMSWIIAERLVSRMREEQAMRDEVAQELVETRRELAQEFEVRALQEVERAQGVEREKLMQDLHDGMGLQLNSLLGLVEKGDAGPGEVQTEVRNSIEQLRTIVDGSEAFDGNLPELLGHIRHRIETRLKRQGIQLVWAGHLGDRIQRVRPSAAVSLQRLIFELCTNVIKHARAENVRFTASLGHLPGVGEILHVLFEDDGAGMVNAVSSSGTGQRSVLRRVAELGGTYEHIAASGSGWKHRLTIPVRSLET